MTKKNAPEEIGFEFAEIKLEEAENLVAAGDGKYSSLVVLLSEKLRGLEESNGGLPLSERKSFAFGLPKGQELEEKARRGLCLAVNNRIQKLSVQWKVSYSGNKKLFVCTPLRSTDNAAKRGPYYKVKNPSAKTKDLYEKIKLLRDRNMSLREIAQTLQVTIHEVKKAYYANTPKVDSPLDDFHKRVLGLKAQGLSISEIAEKLGATLGKINYYLYTRRRLNS